MTVGDQHVFPAVVVVIEKSRAPAEERQRQVALARLKRHVAEIALAVVVQHRVVVVGKIRDVEIDQPIIIIVADP